MPISPYSRYRNLPTLDIAHATRGITRSLPIRRAPSPPALNQGRQHRFAAYEALDQLALKYFGREDLYWYLLDANPYLLDAHRNRLPDNRLHDQPEPGDKLQIPPLSLATRIERPRR